MDLRLQESTSSNQLWATFLLPASPQFLYQAPPGAQQLTRPDFLNAPHLLQIMTDENMLAVVCDVEIDLFATGQCASHRGGDEPHVSCGIVPEEPTNMSFFDASEKTQAAPQSLRLKDTALMNM